MFKKNQTFFGSENCFTYQKNDVDGSMQSLVTIVPTSGANILNLALKGQQILDGHTTSKSLPERDAYKSEILVPFPNRLAEGQFNYQRNTYQFPINDIQHGHALHGLLNDVTFDVVEERLTEKLHLKLKCSYKADQEYYPFYFDLCLAIEIDANRFSISFEIENKGDVTLPIGLGWHPYFIIEPNDRAKINTCVLHHLEMNEKMIPTGEFKKMKFEDESIFNMSLDDTYFISSHQKEAFLKLTRSLPDGKSFELNFQNRCHEEAFKYLQIYHPKMSNSIAIEPMTCNVDALNNKEGLLSLEPGEKKTYSMLIEARLLHA